LFIQGNREYLRRIALNKMPKIQTLRINRILATLPQNKRRKELLGNLSRRE
jgi:hypothetical protein